MEVREVSAVYDVLAATDVDAVPVGYKQTEVGVIPLDWEVSPMSALGVFSKGQGVRKNEAESGDIPCVRYGEIYTWHNDVIRSFNSSISMDVARASKRLKNGDILFAGSGETKEEIGKCVAYLGENEAYAGSDIVILSPSKGVPAFLGYLFNAPVVARQKASRGQGDAVVHISASALSSIKLPLPATNAEQEAIVEALSDSDALIESLEQLLAKKRQIKQGAMQELLTGKKRLPGFRSEWEPRRLDSLANIRSGGTPSTARAELWGGTIPWCTPTDITSLSGFKYLRRTERTITQQGLTSSSAELIPSYSVVMTSRATIGECAINEVPMCTNQGFKNFLPLPKVNADFLYYLLQTKREEFINLCGGSTFLEIGKKQLAAFEVSFPREETEQTAIAVILSDMDTELAALESRLAKTRELKQGMMQDLLTGRIRLAQPVSNVVLLSKNAKASVTSASGHNRTINEAVVIAKLTQLFGSDEWPLARVRRTKLAYLLHRHVEGRADGFLKKAAGPYDPAIRYKGPEGVALKNRYVREHHNGTYEGFVAADNVAQAETYFEKWYGADAVVWLEQFRRKKTDELELLATVDMAMEDLRRDGTQANLGTVKQLIHDHPEWKPKLDKPIFSDVHIAEALGECHALFGG